MMVPSPTPYNLLFSRIWQKKEKEHDWHIIVHYDSLFENQYATFY